MEPLRGSNVLIIHGSVPKSIGQHNLCNASKLGKMHIVYIPGKMLAPTAWKLNEVKWEQIGIHSYGMISLFSTALGLNLFYTCTYCKLRTTD